MCGKAGIVKPVTGRSFFFAVSVVVLLYSATTGIPTRAQIYASSFESMKFDLAKETEAAGIHNAIVFTTVSWGSRIISNLRELNVPASLIETAYRHVDHCELDELTHTAFSDSKVRETLSQKISELLAANEPVEKFALNNYRSLRLRIDRPLTSQCSAQIEYDKKGYILFEPHLVSDDPELKGDVIFARDLGERDGELMQYYKGRAAYRYRPSGFEKLF
jgi:hypothetical protein